MKLIIGIALLLVSTYVQAIEVDPSEQPQRILNCTIPLTYTNGEPIPEGDIAEIRLYETTQPGVYSQTPIATTTGTCQFTVTTTDKPDGSSYYYTATVISARYQTESDRSNEEVLDIVVKRRPMAPVIGWQ